MFPNMRLLIAATFASIVALICGFGMIAALRVGPAPPVRLPPASMTGLAIDDGATSIMAFAAGEPGPFDRHFPATLPPTTRAATNPVAHAPGRAMNVDSSPVAAAAAAATPAPAQVHETAAVIVAPEQSTARAHAQPSREPTAQPADGAAAEPSPAAPEPQPAPVAASVAAAPPDAGDAIGKREPASAPADMAAVAPAVEPAQPADQAAPERTVAPASVASTAATADVEPEHEAAKKPKPAHAARARHLQRASRAAESATHASVQYPSYTQPDFVTAPRSQRPQSAQKRLAQSRHAKLAAGKAKQWDFTSNGATGAPYGELPSK